MKKIIISLLISLIFLPLAVLGQGIGIFIGPIMASIAETWFVASFIVIIIPHLLGGLLGGYISALAVAKIYKSFHLLSAMIIPSLAIILALTGNILVPIIENSNIDFASTISNAVLIISYYYFLKEKNFDF